MPLPTTPGEALAFLAALNPSGMKLGLERVQAVLAALGHPEARVPALHVAGTNGKGSTCAFAASCLKAAGHRVGLFTSPHLVRVNERIQVNGEPLPDERLGQRILEVLARCPAAARTLTYFELGAVVAFWHFSEERLDVAVIETGLGGRLDATNAVAPWVTAITAIGLDHTESLGDTLAAIAREKAGIFKAGVPAIVGAQPPEALAALREMAEAVGAPLVVEGVDFTLDETEAGLSFRDLQGLTLGLRGAHQRRNAAVALAALEQLDRRGLRVPAGALRRGLAETRWPGRLEEFPGAPLIVLDGAHNPAGVEVLMRALASLYPGRSIHLVFGVAADKDHPAMTTALFPRCASLHLTPLDSPRSLEPERYRAAAARLCPAVAVYGSVQDALRGAQRAAKPEDVVLCAGSLFLVGAARALLLQNLGALQQWP